MSVMVMYEHQTEDFNMSYKGSKVSMVVEVFHVWEGDDGVRSGKGHKGEKLRVAHLREASLWMPSNWRAV